MQYRLFTLGVITLACSGPPLNEEASDGQLVSAETKRSTSLQTSEEAEELDAVLIAELRGWTVDEALERQRASLTIGRLGGLVGERRSEVFVGAAAPEVPGAPATLFVKGLADAEVRAMVAATPGAVQISEGHAFSQSELAARQSRLNEALRTAGYRSFAVAVNIRTDSLDVQLMRRPGVALHDEDPLSTLPESLRSGTRIVSVQDSPVYVPDTAFGGMRMSVGCTSGWTVTDDLLNRFIASAGHCSTSANIIHPGEGNHALEFVREHRGEFGDLEIYRTSVDLTPEFFTEGGAVRTVRGSKQVRDLALGETVCMYSPLQDRRFCANVETLQISCRSEDGLVHEKMVRMDADEAIGGDSGGGWENNDIAYGVHGGSCGGLDAWTPVQNLISAFGTIVVRL